MSETKVSQGACLNRMDEAIRRTQLTVTRELESGRLLLGEPGSKLETITILDGDGELQYGICCASGLFIVAADGALFPVEAEPVTVN